MRVLYSESGNQNGSDIENVQVKGHVLTVVFGRLVKVASTNEATDGGETA
jgi:hypothetical protein